MSLNFIPAGDSIRTSVHGLRVNNYLPMIFNDTYRMIRPMIHFWTRKIISKYKHLSNIPIVILGYWKQYVVSVAT